VWWIYKADLDLNPFVKLMWLQPVLEAHRAHFTVPRKNRGMSCAVERGYGLCGWDQAGSQLGHHSHRGVAPCDSVRRASPLLRTLNEGGWP